jgi:hypothetical protein
MHLIPTMGQIRQSAVRRGCGSCWRLRPRCNGPHRAWHRTIASHLWPRGCSSGSFTSGPAPAARSPRLSLGAAEQSRDQPISGNLVVAMGRDAHTAWMNQRIAFHARFQRDETFFHCVSDNGWPARISATSLALFGSNRSSANRIGPTAAWSSGYSWR